VTQALDKLDLQQPKHYVIVSADYNTPDKIVFEGYGVANDRWERLVERRRGWSVEHRSRH
jgi:hypothetical protein